MRRRSVHVIALVVVAVAALVPPAVASGGPPRQSSAVQAFSASDLFTRLRGWLNVTWPLNGCGGDPDGGKCVSPPPGNPDNSQGQPKLAHCPPCTVLPPEEPLPSWLDAGSP